MSTREMTSSCHPPSTGQGAEALGCRTILVVFTGGRSGLPATAARLGIRQEPPVGRELLGAEDAGSRGPRLVFPPSGAEGLCPRLCVCAAPHTAAQTRPRIPLPGSSRVLLPVSQLCQPLRHRPCLVLLLQIGRSRYRAACLLLGGDGSGDMKGQGFPLLRLHLVGLS